MYSRLVLRGSYGGGLRQMGTPPPLSGVPAAISKWVAPHPPLTRGRHHPFLAGLSNPENRGLRRTPLPETKNGTDRRVGAWSVDELHQADDGWV
jgi:hypothetical protein